MFRLANLLADGFSRAVSNYQGTKTELDQVEEARAQEEREIDLIVITQDRRV